MINEALPQDMRDYTRIMNKDTIKKVLATVANERPEEYREIAKRLSDIGADVAYTTGGMSFGLKDLRPTMSVRESRQRLTRRIKDIMSRKDWDPEIRRAKIIEAASAESDALLTNLVDETRKSRNPLALQVDSGARGKPTELKRLLAGDSLYTDNHGDLISFPIKSSFAEGLSPAEFWASTFSARKAMIATKLSTADSGFASKQLNQLAHRLMVTDIDADDEPTDLRGLPVKVTDPDNEGALLAASVAGYPRNTILTPKILQDIEHKGADEILVRSPVVGGPETGGVYARDVGVRERGQIAPLGDMVGLAAAQALSEVLTQMQLASKHSAGMKGATKGPSGFKHVNQLIQVPKAFTGGAAHARKDGYVKDVTPAPTGGYYIDIAGEKHYVMPGYDVRVKRGDTVEAGDILSEGIPNPAEIVKYKGIGEGRKYFIDTFADAYRRSGAGANRRNIELVTRGLIDHVEMLEEDDDHVPGDVVSYQRLESTWKPRIGSEIRPVKQSVGRYLERPVLHYTIGTQIKPSMLPVLNRHGVTSVETHNDEPPFKPYMVRAMATIGHDEDWMTRFLGSGQKKSLLESVHTGAISDTNSSSFVPSAVSGETFGKSWPASILKPLKS